MVRVCVRIHTYVQVEYVQMLRITHIFPSPLLLRRFQRYRGNGNFSSLWRPSKWEEEK